MAAERRSTAAPAQRSRHAAAEVPPTAADAPPKLAIASAHTVGSFRTAAAASPPARQPVDTTTCASPISASKYESLHLPHRNDAERGKGQCDGCDGDQEPYPALLTRAVGLLRQENAFDDGRGAEHGGRQAASPAAPIGVTPLRSGHAVEEQPIVKRELALGDRVGRDRPAYRACPRRSRIARKRQPEG